MMLAATILELMCGLFLKNELGMRAWNYENSFLNYKGVICPLFSLIWGVASFAFCIAQPWIKKAMVIVILSKSNQDNPCILPSTVYTYRHNEQLLYVCLHI